VTRAEQAQARGENGGLAVKPAARTTDDRPLVEDILRGDAWARDRVWRDRDLLDSLALTANAGDRGARNALWLVARPRLERMALASGVMADDVSDLVQETLVAADLRLDHFDARKGALRAWLVTILLRLRINLWKRTSRRRCFLLTISRGQERGTFAAGRGGLDRCEARLDLDRALATLERTERIVLVLSGIEGFGCAEIGRMLGLPARGVRRLARRARARLSRKAGAIRAGAPPRRGTDRRAGVPRRGRC
jgi:RNA polymerase sigma factor (sigma-70 family)